MTEAVYNNIRPRHKHPPRIYGFPKIHKADLPLRPIAYDLSTYLANIMSPLTGSTDFTVNNSAYFVSTISSVLRRRVAVYQRSHRRRCRGGSTETGERHQPFGPLDANTCSDRGPSELCIEIHILLVQRINLRTTGRSSQWKPGFCCYCQPLHGESRRTGNSFFTIQT